MSYGKRVAQAVDWRGNSATEKRRREDHTHQCPLRRRPIEEEGSCRDVERSLVVCERAGVREVPVNVDLGAEPDMSVASFNG